MLEIVRSSASQNIIVTLTELVTITDPYYLFVFTNLLTKEEIKFIKSYDSDLSSFKYRYNKFEIDPSVLFADVERGLYNYVVYEQASDTNIDPTGLNAIEYGKMRLKDTELEFEEYNQAVNYKAYNG